MTDRVGVLGGTLAVHSPPGEGTVVRARMPLPAHPMAVLAPEPTPSVRAGGRERRGGRVADHAALFGLVMFVLVLVWLATGAGTFWPQWVLVSWGAVLALHAALVGIDLRGGSWPRGIAGHAAAFVIAMVALTFVWAITGAGYFWPQWPLIGWGALLAAHVWASRVRGIGRG